MTTIDVTEHRSWCDRADDHTPGRQAGNRPPTPHLRAVTTPAASTTISDVFLNVWAGILTVVWAVWVIRVLAVAALHHPMDGGVVAVVTGALLAATCALVAFRHRRDAQETRQQTRLLAERQEQQLAAVAAQLHEAAWAHETTVVLRPVPPPVVGRVYVALPSRDDPAAVERRKRHRRSKRRNSRSDMAGSDLSDFDAELRGWCAREDLGDDPLPA